MIQSMTGFGASEKDPFKVEIRSVNHRFMEISMRIPPYLGQHEISLRNLIRERFSRGKFDVTVSVAREGTYKVKVNMPLARELRDALLALRGELSLSGTIGIDTIASFRELILSEEIEVDAEPLCEVFREALSRIEEMRLREGETIAKDMLSRLEKIGNLNDELELLTPDAVQSCREKFVGRLKDLFGDAKYDEGRVLQEAAIMAEKLDIAEEVTRIGSHVSQIRKVLSEGGTAGRKVEFLLQELGRETNTVAAKADEYRISSLSVEMRSEIEKIREQAQNIQ